MEQYQWLNAYNPKINLQKAIRIYPEHYVQRQVSQINAMSLSDCLQKAILNLERNDKDKMNWKQVIKKKLHMLDLNRKIEI